MTYTIQIRPKRQITLPKAVTDGLDLEVGDSITVNLQNKQAVLTPNKQTALNALTAIQKAFAESGISEAEMQHGAVEVRNELSSRFYRH